MLCDIQALALRNFSVVHLLCWNAALRSLCEEAHPSLLEVTAHLRWKSS